ncbi:MAG: prepilin-type N-terminal cleavage/methylation domain-containing protein [Mobilitalea sp.]
MKNNKGYSLIELMVVISIASILILGSVSAVRILTFSNTVKITQTIDSQISKNRLLTMSKGNYRYIAIDWNSTKEEYEISMVSSSTVLNTTNWKSSGTIETNKKLASKDVTISYQNGVSATPVMVKDVTLLISNNPSTGAFVSSVTQINIASSSKSSTIYMVTKTGKHYIE